MNFGVPPPFRKKFTICFFLEDSLSLFFSDVSPYSTSLLHFDDTVKEALQVDHP